MKSFYQLNAEQQHFAIERVRLELNTPRAIAGKPFVTQAEAKDVASKAWYPAENDLIMEGVA